MSKQDEDQKRIREAEEAAAASGEMGDKDAADAYTDLVEWFKTT